MALRKEVWSWNAANVVQVREYKAWDSCNVTTWRELTRALGCSDVNWQTLGDVSLALCAEMLRAEQARMTFFTNKADEVRACSERDSAAAGGGGGGVPGHAPDGSVC